MLKTNKQTGRPNLNVEQSQEFGLLFKPSDSMVFLSLPDTGHSKNRFTQLAHMQVQIRNTQNLFKA